MIFKANTQIDLLKIRREKNNINRQILSSQAGLREVNTKYVCIVRSDFVFQKEDRVVFLAKKDSISVVENIFRISSI